VKDNTAGKEVHIQNVDLQNVESQNVDLQNVDLQNADKTKRRTHKTSTVTKGRHYKTTAWSKIKSCTVKEEQKSAKSLLKYSEFIDKS
jgi:uncharacterized protein YjbI with pentapeptide repeats